MTQDQRKLIPVGERIVRIIKMMRLICNFSQLYIAKQCSLKVTAYGNIERGQAEIKLQHILCIAKVYDVDPDALLSGNAEGTIITLLEKHGYLFNFQLKENIENLRKDMSEMLHILKGEINSCGFDT